MYAEPRGGTAIQSKRRQGAFVLDVIRQAGTSTSSIHAGMVTTRYLKAASRLGMSLEDIEQRFALRSGRSESQAGRRLKAAPDAKGRSNDETRPGEQAREAGRQSRRGFSTGFCPRIPTAAAYRHIRSVMTNRHSRYPCNGSVVFPVVVFVLAFRIVLAAAQAAFAEIGLASPS